MEERIVVPNAPILVESTRSIGYSFEAAVADIIDNSLSAKAKEINVAFSSKDEPILRICDNGCGMNLDELEMAMRYGSKSSREKRKEHDLGRFGLGLKVASLSQCKKVTVMSKKKNAPICAACWDIDFIIKKNDWVLKIFSDEEIRNLDPDAFAYLEKHPSGTVVIWENFDRLKASTADSNFKKAFDEKIDVTRKHVSLVFHRFLGAESISSRRRILFNDVKVDAFDPFLTNNPATQPLTEEVLRIDNSKIIVKPYVLPYASKLSKQDINALGDKSELRQKQGFYVYRNKRLIIWGSWFRLIKHNELGRLARVRVDIPNSLDDIWEIDVKKSSATLPHFIKERLASIVKNTVGKSERVYRYRGRKIKDDGLTHVWTTLNDRGALQLLINRDIPIVKVLEEKLDEEGQALLDGFIKTLESTFPYMDVYCQMAKSDTNVSDKPLPKEEVYDIGQRTIDKLRDMGEDIQIFLDSLDKDDLFISYPEIIAKLKRNNK